jgi:hypothetical protein
MLPVGLFRLILRLAVHPRQTRLKKTQLLHKQPKRNLNLK